MKKFNFYKFVIFVLWLNVPAFLISQNIGIGEVVFTPHSSAGLELRFADKGMLIPRMTHAQKLAISSPAEGLMVYCTDNPMGFHYYNGASWSKIGTGDGSVSSVALSMPNIFSVSGSPVTSSGTLTATLKNQNANYLFAGPASGGAAIPSFRKLVAADIPALDYDKYSHWVLQASGTNASNISSGTTVNITGSGASSVTKSGNTITISSTDNNTTYSAGTGLNLSSNVFALSGQALALHNVSTNGFFYRNGSTIGTRVISVSGNGIAISNGNGASGNPTISLNIGTGSAQVAAGNHTHAGMTTGSGTNNYIVKWTPNGTTLGNSQIIDDGNYVRIGGTSTLFRFYVAGSSARNHAIGGFANGAGYGVYGQATSGSAVFGQASTGVGVRGQASGTGDAILGIASGSGDGVYGQAIGGNGVWGQTTSGVGVRGQASGAGYGVLGRSGDVGVVGVGADDGDAIWGMALGAGDGIYAEATTGNGVWGQTATGVGVRGQASGDGDAILGIASGTGDGVYGEAKGGVGIWGVATVAAGIGVRGANNANNNTTLSSGGYGGYFTTKQTKSAAVLAYLGNEDASYYSGTAISGVTTVATAGGGSFGNTNIKGTAVMGAGNNTTLSYLNDGSGGAFTGTKVGLVAWGENTTNGTGVTAAGNGLSIYTYEKGSGGVFYGKKTGLVAKSDSGADTEAIYTENGNQVVRVNHYNASNAHYKIIGDGAVSTIVKDTEGKKVVMHAPETPEYYFMDFGEAQLVNGFAHIDLDPIFSKNVAISKEHPLRVFVQVEGKCNGVYVDNKSSSGFDVIELFDGTSNVNFQWSVVCNVADEVHDNGTVSYYSKLRFEPAPEPLESVQQKAIKIESKPVIEKKEKLIIKEKKEFKEKKKEAIM